MEPAEQSGTRSPSVVGELSSAGDSVAVTSVGDAVAAASDATPRPPTETDSSGNPAPLETATAASSAAAAREHDAPEPERKRGRADGPLPADAFGEAHGRPHTERARKQRDVYGDLALETAPRPFEFGNAGRTIRLYANAFDVSYPDPRMADQPIHHYDIDFIIPPRNPGEPGKQKKMNRIQAWELWQELGPSNPDIAGIFETAAFDGLKNCFSPVRIPLKSNPSDPAETGYSDQLREGHLKCVYKEGKRERDLWISFGLVGDEGQIVPANILRFCMPDYADDAAAREASKKAPIAIQALDSLLRHDVHRKYPIISGQGRKFFAPDEGKAIPKGGEVKNGIFQSLRPTLSGPKVIMDAPYSAFVAGGQLDRVAASIIGKSGGGRGGGGYGGGGRGGYGGGFGGDRGGGGAPLDEREWRNVARYLKKARITLKHRDGGTFEIKSFTREGASERRFMLDHKPRRGEPEPDPPIPPEEISVADYYRHKLNIQLVYPHYPCVEIRGRQLIPVELCQLLPGQPVPFLLTSPEQTAEVIRAAGKPPPQRMAEILNARKKASYHGEDGHEGGTRRLGAWGVRVSNEMTKVVGRILPPPRVMLDNGPANVRFGKWNLIGARFIKPSDPLMTWSVLNFDRDVQERDIQSFIGTLIQAGSNAGMVFADKQPPILSAGHDIRNSLKMAGKACIVRGLEVFGKRLNPQLVLCIVPDRSAAESRSVYEAIKRISLTELPSPMVTQCMKASKVRQTKPNAALQYCGNLSTKMNLKLGGRNWTLDAQSLPIPPGTIIFGADIAHAAPGSRGASVASVVAATDGSCSDWKAEIRSQDAGVESIAGLDDMVYSHLKLYEKTAGRKPSSLIFYRDGVSEGEFKQVIDVEIAGVRAACERYAPGTAIPITFIICGKTSKTRFFAAEHDLALCDRNGNLPAGTVVDRSITHPLVWDFYLQAHSGLLGTAKPTHYNVLCDENGFDQNRIQALSNGLCWLFGRATMGVSLVAPAYLADLACEKARLLIATEFDDASTTTSNSNEQPALYLDPLKIHNALNRDKGVPNGWFI